MDPQVMELLMAMIGGQGANAGMGQAAGMMPPGGGMNRGMMSQMDQGGIMPGGMPQGMMPHGAPGPGQPGMMDQLMQLLGGQQPQMLAPLQQPQRKEFETW